MLVGPTRASFLAATLSVASLGVVVAACSPASATSGSSASRLDAPPPCPASFAAVATATCSVEGQSCPYLVPCTTFASNAVCVCTGGSFVCSGYGDAGTACPVLTTTQACPVSERAASGLFCSDLGLICTYPTACPGIPEYDACQCVGGRTADEQTHFECNLPCVPVDGAAPSLSDASPLEASTTEDDAAPEPPPADATPSNDAASGP